MPRLPYVERSSLSSEDQAALATVPDFALLRILGNAPTVMRPWLSLGAAFLAGLELSPRRRELAILAVAQAAACEYERVQHEAIARVSGVTDGEIAEIARGSIGAFAPADAAVIRLATEAVGNIEVTAETMGAAHTHLGERQTVELLCLVGFYVATAILARSTDVDIDGPNEAAVLENSSRLARRDWA
jgi:4-carboxymuconolactone decarboxylase